jgi:RNA polymerase sigma factor (sigma-70 family)
MTNGLLETVGPRAAGTTGSRRGVPLGVLPFRPRRDGSLMSLERRASQGPARLRVKGIGVDERDTAELVTAAEAGDASAWSELVDRYSGLVWAIARGFALSVADASDVSQTTWLRLVEHLGRLREPEHLGGWLATTARHECFKVLRRRGREIVGVDVDLDAESGEPTPEVVVLDNERDRLVWASLGEIPQRCQVLLRALAAAPPASYLEISAALDMPIGSIGPTRARCLGQLKKRLHAHQVVGGAEHLAGGAEHSPGGA